jgi:hypothetical protein
MEYWDEIYRTAVLECDPKKLQSCVQTAEHTIQQRSAPLHDPISGEERLAMEDPFPPFEFCVRNVSIYG